MMEECCRDADCACSTRACTSADAGCAPFASESTLAVPYPSSFPVLPGICARPSYISLVFFDLPSPTTLSSLSFPNARHVASTGWFGIQRLLRVDYGVATTMRWTWEKSHR